MIKFVNRSSCDICKVEQDVESGKETETRETHYLHASFLKLPMRWVYYFREGREWVLCPECDPFAGMETPQA